MGPAPFSPTTPSLTIPESPIGSDPSIALSTGYAQSKYISESYSLSLSSISPLLYSTFLECNLLSQLKTDQQTSRAHNPNRLLPPLPPPLLSADSSPGFSSTRWQTRGTRRSPLRGREYGCGLLSGAIPQCPLRHRTKSSHPPGRILTGLPLL